MTKMSFVLLRLARTASLILVAALGTIALVRFAPGYFSDAREFDGQYAESARAVLKTQQQEQRSVFTLTRQLLTRWIHGDLGRSRQYDVPVAELMEARTKTTGKLLFSGLSYGWLLALALALLLSSRRTSHGEALIAGPSAILLAIPIGAMATMCLIADAGGPILVLTTLIGVRDFKALYRLLRQTWRAPHLLYARSQGISTRRIALIHLLPFLRTELVALAVTSFVIALSAVVPVEVIFDVPGLGQLVWSAAMNRDLQVLLAITVAMAACIGLAGAIAPAGREWKVETCV